MNFFVNGAMGIGNSGVEHAQFYRAKRFEQRGIPYKFIFMELIDNLHEAMDKWDIAENKVINMWEYFVLGPNYLDNGVEQRGIFDSKTLIDSTNTNRQINVTTVSGMRIVKHAVKYKDMKDPEKLMVSVGRVEIFDQVSKQKKVMYESLPSVHGGTKIVNVHLYGQGKHQHLFFSSLVKLSRYFFEQIENHFGNDTTFIVDRGEENAVALMTGNNNPARKLVNVIHADHLTDRNDPKNPMWNNYYEYLLTHINLTNRVVVATKLQKEDLLIDFPNEKDKIVAIPVGGVNDKVTDNPKRRFGKPLRLMTISRLAAEKHIDLIVKAVIKINEERERVTLDIYGTGGEQGKLEDLIKENHAGKYVTLKGLTHHAEKVYPQYDAFVSASYSEGFGLTYIEALNAGLPVVTFDARFGAQELIHDNVNGIKLQFKRDNEEFNVNQLISGIKRLKNANYQQMRANIIKSVEDYRDAKIAKQWEELINGL